MNFGSVCSGIEAASVAWHPLGWTAAWLAEIEAFPSAVLAHHYPDVPNLGDMTAIAADIYSGAVPAPDILVGGTPCQAFSVAGMRKGLEDARGQLTIRYVELANAIDDVRISEGDEPAIIVWENVPGVLSSKDNAFGCFLGALAGEACELQPPGGKWRDAGCVLGPQRAIAWRVLDAQFFGVAQRRRRVFVVASAREGFDPASVLFEREGVRRDTAPSRVSWQEFAASSAGCADLSCGCGYSFGADLGAYGCPNCEGDEGPAEAVAPQEVVVSNAEGATGLPFLTCSNIAKTVNNQTPLLSFPWNTQPAQSISVPHVSVCPTLRAGGNQTGGDRPIGTDVDTADSLLSHGSAVRRLTPRECERLQGFPDDYTLIPHRNKPADQCPDGPRYKALGNSMAVPCMGWIGRRLQAFVCPRDLAPAHFVLDLI